MNWFIYALLSAIFLALYSLMVRRLLKGKGDVKAFTFWLDFFAAIFLFFLAFLEKRYSLLNFTYLGLIVFLAFVSSLVDLLFIRGRQLEEVSKVSIAVQFGSVWALLGGAVFFKEPLLPAKILGAFLVIAGNIIILWEGQRLNLTKGLGMIFLGSALFISVSLADKYLVKDVLSPAWYKSLVFFLSALWILAFTPNRFQRLKKEIFLQKAFLPLSGFLFGSSLYFFIKGLQVGEISRVSPVHSLSLIMAVLGGILFLNERKRARQKIIGAIVAFIGIFLLRGA